MTNEIRICAQCRHIRQKLPVNPFAHVSVWTAEQIKLRAEWQKERTQISIQEEHRFRAGDEFDYEPESLAWCAAWTAKSSMIIDPVTGKQMPVYALCVRSNAHGDCSLFEDMNEARESQS